MSNTTKTTTTTLGLVTCGKDFKTLHIGTVTHETKMMGTIKIGVRSIESTANCAGARHVSDKYRSDLQAATCPRCRAAYLGQVAAPVATPAPVVASQPDPEAIQKGDYLTLTYGNGTQTAYVADTTPGQVMIYRLVGYTGRWTGPRPMSRKDGRIVARVASPEGVEPPATGFIAAR